jgi:hypothetical protein
MGWCVQCVTTHHPELSVCPNCNSTFPSKNNNRYCKKCMHLNWLESNIDAIEEYMIQGYSFTTARYRVMSDIRPTCLGCGVVIKNARPGSRFCTTNSTCRTYLRRYRRLVQNGMDREDATRKAIDERDPNHLRGVFEG